jgi:hypothetical protein
MCRDEKDLMVFGAAVAGDKDLLSVDEFQDIKILDPRAYWNEMKNTAGR